MVIPVAVFLLGWGVKKLGPFLDTQAQEVYATPTVQPTDAATLAPIPVKGGKQVCLHNVEYGPGAKYVYVTITTTRPAGPIAVEARAQGYDAKAVQPAGAASDVPLIVKIAPAPREVGDGTLCLTNLGRHQIRFYGIHPGRGSSPTTTTVDGKAIPEQLSVTLLTSPSKSLGSRIGTIFDHVAAFRPVTGWEVWIVAILALIGAPVAIVVALVRATAQDEAPPPAD
ncbi:hypothetical protein FSW04_00785 [Baekduia soli]|uniref:Uncharacterized protein n=1 Tax=Baekduia soli TaxID=496014 RepID=A0A5B8TZU6_9ACTN|nr:hypothetical protein [Baekduia soli]QEC46251.1 hypothetical protein FSW04_00785 [Baekduia soli]